MGLALVVAFALLAVILWILKVTATALVIAVIAALIAVVVFLGPERK